MRNYPEHKEYEFVGVLAPICRDFIAEKRAVGYIYNAESKNLRQFSRFTEGFNFRKETLPEEVVKAWIEKRPNDSDRTRYARFALIKIFAEYMTRMNYLAYVPSREEVGKCRKSFIPYIFTHDEIRRFFAAVDEMTLSCHSIAPRRHLIMPVLFRALYCCGLRVSEATELRGADVDLQSGILTIKDTKFGKSRYVPMSPELTEIYRDYAKTRLVGKGDGDWFFAAPDGGHYGGKGIYQIFRELLWKAGISHGGRGKGPRVHDFRHTFAVHCLQKWVSNGADITSALPRLKEYLGHSNFETTEQYLRMTAEVYPEISALMERNYGYVIPKIEGESYDAT
ncbi:MAG: tyrosine-type recombinase/integrase [Clostridiales bacterium]|jgi:integrase|nr:tyrosine-type recombinase/integrase [Clostridiales bacterium]